eukprot:RCo005087
MPEAPAVVKLLLIGDSTVGKSAFLQRFVEDTFSDSYITTVGIDFKERQEEVDGAQVKIQLWDTAGQERFRTITAAYYRGAHGIILMYDLTSRESFKNLTYWMAHIDKYAGDARDRVARVIVGNKSDLKEKRVVPTSEGQQLAQAHTVDLYEVSAKTGEGVRHAVLQLTREVLKRRPEQSSGGAGSKPGLTVAGLMSTGGLASPSRPQDGGCAC